MTQETSQKNSKLTKIAIGSTIMIATVAGSFIGGSQYEKSMKKNEKTNYETQIKQKDDELKNLNDKLTQNITEKTQIENTLKELNTKLEKISGKDIIEKISNYQKNTETAEQIKNINEKLKQIPGKDLDEKIKNYQQNNSEKTNKENELGRINKQLEKIEGKTIEEKITKLNTQIENAKKLLQNKINEIRTLKEQKKPKYETIEYKIKITLENEKNREDLNKLYQTTKILLKTYDKDPMNELELAEYIAGENKRISTKELQEYNNKITEFIAKKYKENDPKIKTAVEKIKQIKPQYETLEDSIKIDTTYKKEIERIMSGFLTSKKIKLLREYSRLAINEPQYKQINDSVRQK